MSQYQVINVLDLLDQASDSDIEEIFAEFSCPQNPEIEHFLFENAISFALKKMSVSYLVFNDNGDFVGYFSLTHKPIIVPSNLLSKTMKKKMCRFSTEDQDSHCFTVSAFLIAQFGKNYSLKPELRINGSELMSLALEQLKTVQHLVGGGTVFLECEDVLPLLSFYQSGSCNFFRYGIRTSETDGIEYHQLLRFF